MSEAPPRWRRESRRDTAPFSSGSSHSHHTRRTDHESTISNGQPQVVPSVRRADSSRTRARARKVRSGRRMSRSSISTMDNNLSEPCLRLEDIIDPASGFAPGRNSSNEDRSRDLAGISSDSDSEDYPQALIDAANYQFQANFVPPHAPLNALPLYPPATFGAFSGIQVPPARLHRMLQRGRGAAFTRTTRATSGLATPPILLLYRVEGNDMDELRPDIRHNISPQTRYLPLVPVSAAGARKPNTLTIHPAHKCRMDELDHGYASVTWPSGEIPMELFDAITDHLSRDDVKAMRLVSKEFEQKVSSTYFDSAVVPFNTELYDMVEQEINVRRESKGKGKAKAYDNHLYTESGSLPWKNATEDREHKVYRGHGLQVFQGFGQHIKNFGMSFEVKEAALRDPPKKHTLDHLESFYGSYNWPPTSYTRFDALAGLERTADETSQMKLALSHLSKVRQLALSLDNGLGWLNGPDKSVRSQIIERDSHVFGSSHALPNANQQAQQQLWNELEAAHRAASTLQTLKEGQLVRFDLKRSIQSLPGLSDTPYCYTNTWASMSRNVMSETSPKSDEEMVESRTTGALCVLVDEYESDRSETTKSAQRAANHDVTPLYLTKDQKEWLLEAEWAQKAFLQSYMLAIVDNYDVFEKVTVLKLARLASEFVPMLSRQDFWAALPNVAEVALRVVPAWRTIYRDEAGYASDAMVEPSKAHDVVYNLIQDHISNKATVKKLHVGWAAGGEDAEGLFARNHHLLPAPVTTLVRSVYQGTLDTSTVYLPHVEHLTLSNCWITPITLTNVVHNLEKLALTRLTLDSVSLTAHPKFGVDVQNIPPPPALNPAPQAAIQFAGQFWLGPQNGMPLATWATGMLQTMHHWMQHHGIPQQQLHQMVGPGQQPGTFFTMHQALVAITHGQQPHALPAQGAFNFVPPQQAVFQGFQAMFQPPPPPPPPPVAAGTGQSSAPRQWYDRVREGSWVDLVDRLSPGPRLDHYRQRDEFDPAPVTRDTALVTLEFKSCGYVHLHSATFDQTTILAPIPHKFTRRFQRRQAALASVMMCSNDKYLGRIVQHMPERESNALRFGWSFTMGWEDEKRAEEAEHNGCLPGGTGRFSGQVSRNDTPNPFLVAGATL